VEQASRQIRRRSPSPPPHSIPVSSLHCSFVTRWRGAALAGFGSLGLSCASTHSAEPRPATTVVAEPAPRASAPLPTQPPPPKLSDLLGKPLPDVAFEILTPELFERIQSPAGPQWKPSSAPHVVLVLEFFGSSCGEECRASMEELEDLYSGLEGYGLLVVDVDSVFDPSQTKTDTRNWSVLLGDVGQTIPTVMASRPALLRLGVADLPTTVIVDHEGVVRYVHAGASSETRAEVEGLVNARARARGADSAGRGDAADEPGQGIITLGNLGKIGGSPTNANHARVRAGDVRATGDLPVEIIERIVHQNFGRYRFCYEDGLRSNRNLAGTISLHFTIDADGTVGSAPTAGTPHFADRRVVECVLNGVRNLAFPQPQTGVVNVVFDLVFTPLEQPSKR